MLNPLNRVSRLLQAAHRTSHRPRRFRPRLERLEERAMLVNDIQASFAAGILTIKTVDQFAEAAVLAGDNNQNFQIIGTGPGNVTLHKSGATNINGAAADLPFAGVTSIVINLKEGNDFVTCKVLDIAGDFTYNGGDGGNTLNMDNDTGTSKVRNLTFNNGDGVDNFAFLDGSFIVSGALTINYAEGGSNSNIGFFAGDNVTILGPANITAAAGSDNINFSGNNFQAKGTFTINGGTGDNGVHINYFNSVVFAKPLSITNLAGDDVFAIGQATNKSTSFAGLTINNGSGKSDISFASDTSDTINGNLLITNGAGDDKLTVDPVDFTVTGMVVIKNGTGSTTTDISPTNTNTVGGAFMLTSAAGDDTTTIAGATVNYKAVAILNGNGDSNTQFSGTNLSFSSISNTNGDGLDTFGVTATSKFQTLVGGIVLKNGTGGSTTTLAATGAATAAIKGALSITNADGSDTTIIGNGSGDFSGLHAVTITNGAGNSTTTFNPTKLTVTGSITVTNGDGFDNFALGNGATTTFAVSGSLKLNNGIGGSTNNLNPTSAGAIGGAFSVACLDGNDVVDVIRTTVSGATTFSLGAGSDRADIDNSALAALSIAGGGGVDQIRIEATTNDGISTTITGVISIKMGRGNDVLEIGLDADDKVTTSAAFAIDGGLGLDTFDQHAAANTFAIVPVILSVEVLLP
jgi:hypothetical protein